MTCNSDEAQEKYYYIYMTYYNMSISQSEKGSGRQQMLCLKKVFLRRES